MRGSGGRGPRGALEPGLHRSDEEPTADRAWPTAQSPGFSLGQQSVISQFLLASALQRRVLQHPTFDHDEVSTGSPILRSHSWSIRLFLLSFGHSSDSCSLFTAGDAAGNTCCSPSAHGLSPDDNTR